MAHQAQVHRYSRYLQVMNAQLGQGGYQARACQHNLALHAVDSQTQARRALPGSGRALPGSVVVTPASLAFAGDGVSALALR